MSSNLHFEKNDAIHAIRECYSKEDLLTFCVHKGNHIILHEDKLYVGFHIKDYQDLCIHFGPIQERNKVKFTVVICNVSEIYPD